MLKQRFSRWAAFFVFAAFLPLQAMALFGPDTFGAKEHVLDNSGNKFDIKVSLMTYDGKKSRTFGALAGIKQDVPPMVTRKFWSGDVAVFDIVTQSGDSKSVRMYLPLKDHEMIRKETINDQLVTLKIGTKGSGNTGFESFFVFTVTSEQLS